MVGCRALWPSAGAEGTTVEQVESATDVVDLAWSLFHALSFPMVGARCSRKAMRKTRANESLEK